MNTSLGALFRYKAWANRELLAALAAFDAARNPTRFRAMLDILGHANVVDRIFRNHLSGTVVETIDSTDPERPPTLPELRAVVEATDAWYLGFVSDVDADRPARVKLLVASVMQPMAEYLRDARPLRRPSRVPG